MITLSGSFLHLFNGLDSRLMEAKLKTGSIHVSQGLMEQANLFHPSFETGEISSCHPLPDSTPANPYWSFGFGIATLPSEDLTVST
jgi:hypothetical protein